MEIKGKYSPINNKNIRTMTPSEWGRLQGFIGYAFMKDGRDEFSFPEGVPNVQKFKQFGNSVTIPVIEEMALFIRKSVDEMYESFSKTEQRIFSMYGNEFLLCSRLYEKLSQTLREETINSYFNMVYHYKLNEFRIKDLAEYLGVTAARASQIMSQITCAGCAGHTINGAYRFKNLLDMSN